MLQPRLARFSNREEEVEQLGVPALSFCGLGEVDTIVARQSGRRILASALTFALRRAMIPASACQVLVKAGDRGCDHGGAGESPRNSVTAAQ